MDGGKVSDAIVVGAGLAGLSCAHALRSRGCGVHVLEASKHIGGVVGTFDAGGFLFESGPNTVPASAVSLREVSAELGIAGELITSRPEAKRRYLFQHGGLHELPSSPLALVRTPLLSRAAKRRILSEPFRRFDPERWAGAEPNFEDFLAERIGSEATRTLAGAFVRGVYAAEIDELGARSAFPRLWDLCTKGGGLMRGMMARGKAAKRARRGAASPPPGPRTPGTDLLSYTGGFSVLTRGFGRALSGDVSTNTAVVEIDRGPGGWRAILESGEALSCRELILAMPAPACHPLVAMCAPERLDLDALRDIDHAAITAVHLGLEGVELPPGFGFLVPPDEEARGDPRTPGVLGMLFISNLFEGRAPTGTASITAMFRGGAVADLVGDQLVDRAVRALERALAGYDLARPGAVPTRSATRVVASRIQRWTHVIPRYGPGHGERMDKLVASAGRMLPGLHLGGSYVGGVSVEDRLRFGRGLAAKVHDRLSHHLERDGTSTGAPRTEEAS